MTLRVLRFPQLAVSCPWCHAAIGDLCTGARTRARTPRRTSTHEARRTAWVVSVAACPACQVAPGTACRNVLEVLPASGVHASRDAEAVRTQPSAATPRLEVLGDQTVIPFPRTKES